jgi:tRNA (guanine37-N1)-methyltransferase
MVMKPEPLAAALRNAKTEAPDAAVLLMSPQGRSFDQNMARRLAAAPGLIFICGRYEGIDERVTEQFVDLEISVGDYVLTGGELPAMVIMDAVTRLLPGALGNEDSADQDSFGSGRLDCGHYTRPPGFEGREVPEILLSGHHEQVRSWRCADALMRSLVKRPDLLRSSILSAEELGLLKKWRLEIERLLCETDRAGLDSPPGGG